MNPDSRVLFNFLVESLPVETKSEEIEYTCKHIYCTLSYLPAELQKLKLTKENIADAFAEWSKISNKEKDNRECWIDIISSVLKSTKPLDTSRPLPFKLKS